MDFILLVIGFIFTFLVPGICVLQFFFPALPARIKIPLVPILSVLVSTYFVYVVSLVMGYSRFSILVAFFFFIPFLSLVFREFWRDFILIRKTHYLGLLVAVFVFLIYLLALYPGIFTKYNGYIVMSSSNWQDTAMHLGIIESLSQGNFPPQAPYFAGVPLHYYYFTDFHSSILETLYGQFFPRILVYDNPLFAAIFSLLVYFLAYEVTKDKSISFFSSLLAPFISNYMFVGFIKDWLRGGGPVSLITNNSYALEFGGRFQISPMADYFLQNRPMMAGLPAFVAVILLSICLFRKRISQLAILAGLMTAALVKFQFFASLVSLGAFLIISAANFSQRKNKAFRRSIFYFVAFYIVFLLLFVGPARINGKSLGFVFLENFTWGPWERGKSLWWYLEFIIKNLGVPCLAAFLTLFIKKKKRIGALIFLALGLTLVPFVAKFTIMKYDMLKFNYFAEVIYSFSVFWFLRRILKNKYLFITASVLVIITSSFTSFLNLTNSFLNKTMAYTQTEVDSGLWIRKETPRRSVFVDLANLHSPITEIGGRLRVLSYINWPHSHGYNTGRDNVFSRLEDINNLYLKNDTSVLAKYNVDYVYYGQEERRSYPQAENNLENSEILAKAFDNGEVKIFKVLR